MVYMYPHRFRGGGRVKVVCSFGRRIIIALTQISIHLQNTNLESLDITTATQSSPVIPAIPAISAISATKPGVRLYDEYNAPSDDNDYFSEEDDYDGFVDAAEEHAMCWERNGEFSSSKTSQNNLQCTVKEIRDWNITCHQRV